MRLADWPLPHRMYSDEPVSAMRDVITKLRILWFLLSEQFEMWRTDIWHNDLDSHYCCDGRECGCQAATSRDIYPTSRTGADQ